MKQKFSKFSKKYPKYKSFELYLVVARRKLILINFKHRERDEERGRTNLLNDGLLHK